MSKEVANIEFTPEMLEEMDQKQRVQILRQASNELFKYKDSRPEEWNKDLEKAHELIKKQIEQKSKPREVKG